MEGEAAVLPTAVFFNAEDRSVHIGRDAVALYLAGVEGRLMRSLKSLLGSSLIDEHTAVGTGTLRYLDILTLFLRELLARSRPRIGDADPLLVLGRPVHFVDADPARDRQAQDALEQAARAAGFGDIAFELEPVAAAFDYERRLTREAIALVVDVGGGTSDFSVLRLGPKGAMRPDRSADVLATAGVHLGGTDFDRRLNLARVMPLLGLGHRGPQGREVPNPVFHDLATWHLINFLHAPSGLSRAQALRSAYTDPSLHDRLMTVLRQRLGHRLATEVEQAKIACSVHEATALMRLDDVEAGLQAELAPAQMHAQLDALLAQVTGCAQECLRRAGAPALDAIYLTGGSSALRPLQEQLAARFPGVALVAGDLFGGVAAGLAYSAGQRYA
ncbi:Hsp70 family protein [Ramlibacter sp. AW1]|uniref:Hsp70 family protein n=2 Tax=Ramlibacter aurantiacus TaxID=2801330 RepID=A0A936ZQR6_9BURK|nr:Hsp70 family protein [Ramlibacter aurantiacus]